MSVDAHFGRGSRPVTAFVREVVHVDHIRERDAGTQPARADLPLHDPQSFEDARRGLIEAAGEQVIMGRGGPGAVLQTPAGFREEAVGENLIPGNAMSRRAHDQFGPLLPRREKARSMPAWAGPRRSASSR
jgi:alkyl sulfatase BDS1-like metallo-beta-lactamase superfamily hydrolase